MTNKIFLFCLVLLVATSLYWGGACSDGGSTNFYDAVTSTANIETVTFNIEGQAVCQKCKDNDVDVAGFVFEIAATEHPAKAVRTGYVAGFGSFSIKDIFTAKGTELKLYGTLYTGDANDPITYTASKIFNAPDDGSTISVTLNF